MNKIILSSLFFVAGMLVFLSSSFAVASTDIPRASQYS